MIARPILTLLILAAPAASALVGGCGARFYDTADLTITVTPRSGSSGSREPAELSIEPRVWTDAEAGGHGPEARDSEQP